MRATSALLAMAIALPISAIAQTPPPYQPGMGDLMVMIVQPRHLKLGLAGQARNWDYADYAHIPKWRDFDVVQLMAATVKQPLEEIEKAVKARNAAAFDAAYRQLTESCNACHRSTNLPAIVIKVPDAAAFPNQEFRGGRP